MGEAMTSEHNAPHNLEAEEAVLGAMMLSASCIDVALSKKLTDRDFYRPAHRILFRTILSLHERGEGVDFLVVVNELRHRKQLAEAGGTAFVATLEQRTPAVANVSAYVDEVLDQAQRRCLLDTGMEIQRLAYEDTDQDVGSLGSQMSMIVDRALSYLRRSNRSGRSSEELAEWAGRHLLNGGDERIWFPFPVQSLQEAVRGFATGQLVVVGAESSVGKSAFGTSIILAAPPETSIGYFNLEMTAEEVELRLISTLSGIAVDRLLQPRLDGTFDLSEAEQDAYLDAATSLGERNFTVYDVKTLPEIEQIQRTEKHDLILTDHMHRLPGNEEYAGLVKITRACKNIALNTGCAHVALAQFNRASEFATDEAPTLRRLRGGQAIEDEADIALLLHREKNEHGFRTPEGSVIVAKNRNGQSGFAVPCVFNGSRMRWEDKR